MVINGVILITYLLTGMILQVEVRVRLTSHDCSRLFQLGSALHVPRSRGGVAAQRSWGVFAAGGERMEDKPSVQQKHTQSFFVDSKYVSTIYIVHHSTMKLNGDSLWMFYYL